MPSISNHVTATAQNDGYQIKFECGTRIWQLSAKEKAEMDG